VNISGLTISGTDSTNYSLTQPTATADITAKQLPADDIDKSIKNEYLLPNVTNQLQTNPQIFFESLIISLAYGKEIVNISSSSNFGFNLQAQMDTNIYKRYYLPGTYITIVTVLEGKKIEVDIFNYNEYRPKKKRTVFLDTGEQTSEEFTVR
jgi:hypothetical protein